MDEVRTWCAPQVAAVVGNVGMVVPGGAGAGAGSSPRPGRSDRCRARGKRWIAEPARSTTLLFAAFTGAAVRLQHLIAGWVENWFVLHRLDSAIQYNPRITACWLARARRPLGALLRGNISGWRRISLGFMLGLTPPFAAFFGLGLEARHVTLSTGQIGAAAALRHGRGASQAFWWAWRPYRSTARSASSFTWRFWPRARHNVSGGPRNI